MDEAEKIGACRLRIGFERSGRFHRIVVKVAEPRVDQFEKRRFRQAEACDRIEQGRSDGIGLGTRLACPFERVPPPLEPDFAEQRLGDDFPHARNFKAERIKGVNMRPQRAAGQKDWQASGPGRRGEAHLRNRHNRAA